MTIRLIGFTGETPRLSPRLLPDMGSQMAFETRLENGDLRPIRYSRNEFSANDLPVNAPATIYKFLGTWLYWPKLVNAVPGPVAADRLYYTGDGVPKMRVGATIYSLAIPFPTVALTGTLTGTATSPNITERRYVYTNVSQFGEESEPSPISGIVNWQPGLTVTLSGFSTAMGDRTATFQRIYRSQTTTSGQATLYLIQERAASTANYVDTKAPDEFQEELPSTDYNQPPAGLTGLIALPNGMMAAFVGKRLYFCEPYIPHAWPERYILTTEFDIVALGAFGTTIVLMTKGNPYIVSGASPEAMTMEKLELNLPCINAAGVVDLGYAIVYPSYDGLVSASAGGVRLATEALFSRTQWQTLNPTTMVAGQHNGRYLASYSYTDAAGQAFSATLILDMTGTMPFLIRTADIGIAFFYDPTTLSLYYLSNGVIYEWDAVGQPSKTQTWRSKPFVEAKPVNYGAMLIEVQSALTPAQIAENEAQRAQIIAQNNALMAGPSLGGQVNGAAINVYGITDDALLPVPNSQRIFCNVNVYADGKLVQSVTTYNQVARLVAGFRARVWEFEITSNATVIQAALARSPAELAVVQ